jgi:hypothetical protein
MEVLHLPLKRSDSIKKKTVAATIAMDIIQKVIPTVSFGSRFPEAANESVGSPANKVAGIKYFKKDIYKLPYTCHVYILATARDGTLCTNKKRIKWKLLLSNK